MVGPKRSDALGDEPLGGTVGFGDEVGITLVLNGNLPKVGHKERAGFARDRFHLGDKGWSRHERQFYNHGSFIRAPLSCARAFGRVEKFISEAYPGLTPRA